MEHLLLLALCITASYIFGSVMGAYWISLWFRLPDPWLSGSNNPGATNIYRLAGWLPALLTLTWDAIKGALGVSLALAASLGIVGQGAVAMAAVLGHMLPVFHKFKGGKGVATVLGCGLVLVPLTTLALTLIWSAALSWKRISSLASLISALCAPALCWWLDPEYTLIFSLLALFIAIRHWQNIVKLTRGKEHSLS
jgi:glycerol-3-phosphate acyltransferase PlsY